MRARPAALIAAFFGALLGAAVPDCVRAGEIEYLRVNEIRGRAEVRASASGGWQTAASGAVLRKGDRLRTSPESSVYLSFDRDLHGGGLLDESSELRVVSVLPPRLQLERGELFVLRGSESDGLSEPPDRRILRATPLVVSAAALDVRLSWGGASIDLTGPRLTVRVFDERVEVGEPDGTPPPMSVTEGFKYAVQPRERGAIFRMTFEDYRRWETWMRFLYERKDDLAAERREEALSS